MSLRDAILQDLEAGRMTAREAFLALEREIWGEKQEAAPPPLPRPPIPVPPPAARRTIMDPNDLLTAAADSHCEE